MPNSPHVIVCHEAGSGVANCWSEPIDVQDEDLRALRELADRKRILLSSMGSKWSICGLDYVGSLVLPSGNHICIRSKVEGLTLLRWFGFIHECPIIEDWVQQSGFHLGKSFPKNLAHVYIKELRRLTQFHLRKGYVAKETSSSSIRGRVDIAKLMGRAHLLPRLPQVIRARSLQTLPNRVLASALDRIAPVFAYAQTEDREEYALLRGQWSSVTRELEEPASAVAQSLQAIPHGYRSALQLAALILRGFSIVENVGSGGQMFMHRISALWEQSLRKMCQESCKRGPWSHADAGGRTRPWDDAFLLDGADRFLTVDVLLKRGPARWVFDAKYKRGFGDEDRVDRFQMCAYALAFDAERVTLVYPTGTCDAALSRSLLSTRIGERSVLIESLALPMASGPEVCVKLLEKHLLGQT